MPKLSIKPGFESSWKLDKTLVNKMKGLKTNKYSAEYKVFRPWQNECFSEYKDTPYFILNAPMAAGKSFLISAMLYQRLISNPDMKVIIAVPQTIIGSSFRAVKMIMPDGTTAEWLVYQNNDLTIGTAQQKEKNLITFLKSKPVDIRARICICAHPTLIKTFQTKKALFKNLTVVIDEAHHVMCDDSLSDQKQEKQIENRLGSMVKHFVKSKQSNVQIVLATATFFRGDRKRILPSDVLDTFKTYNLAFDAFLSSCLHLRGLKYDFCLYSSHSSAKGSIVAPKMEEALLELFKTKRKTIIYVRPVSGHTDYMAQKEADQLAILKAIAGVTSTLTMAQFKSRYVVDSAAPIWVIKCKDGSLHRVVNLVDTENREEKKKIIIAAHDATTADDVDTIIALNMLKEGANWQWADREVIIGNRNSFTDVMQMIGRILRDAPGKSVVEVFHLIDIKPSANKNRLAEDMNNYMKAVFLSLLMEDVIGYTQIRGTRNRKPYEGVRWRDRFESESDYNNCLSELAIVSMNIEASKVLKTDEERAEAVQEAFVETLFKYGIPNEEVAYFYKSLTVIVKNRMQHFNVVKNLDVNKLSKLDIKLLSLVETNPLAALQYQYTTDACSAKSFESIRSLYKNLAYDSMQSQINVIKDAGKRRLASGMLMTLEQLEALA